LRFAGATLVGIILGKFIFALLCGKGERFDTMMVLTGSTFIAAGIAYCFGVSVIWITLLAGIIIANSRPRYVDLYPIVAKIEHPLYLMFLAFAGLMWNPTNMTALVLSLILIFIKLATKGAVFHFVSKRVNIHGLSGKTALALMVPGGISIAMVMNASMYCNQFTLCTLALDTLVWALVILNPVGVLLARKVIPAGRQAR